MLNKILLRLRTMFLVALLPVIEFLFLRILLQRFLQIRIGWGPYLIDADLLVPTLTVFLVFFLFCEEFSFKARKKALLLNLTSLAFATYLSFFLPKQSDDWNLLQGTTWGLAVGFTLISSVIVYMPLAFLFQRKHAGLIAACCLILFSILICKNLFASVWLQTIGLFSRNYCSMLGEVLGERVDCKIVARTQGPTALVLFSPKLRAVVGPACGGFDGVLFCLSVSFLLWFRYQKTLSLWQWLCASVLGMVSIYLINLLRIGFLFVAAVYSYEHFSQKGLDLFTFWVHAHVGYLAYLMFGIFYFPAVLQICTLKEQKDLPNTCSPDITQEVGV